MDNLVHRTGDWRVGTHAYTLLAYFSYYLCIWWVLYATVYFTVGWPVVIERNHTCCCTSTSVHQGQVTNQD